MSEKTPARFLLGLLAVAALAFAVRGLGFQWVFIGEDVVFAPGDAMYHARRVLYGFEHFPRVLFFDPYINFPGGAAVSWPPLFDFALSALGRAFTDGGRGLEVLVAWSGPVIAALTCLPVFWLGRTLATPGVGLGAAAFFAVLPVSVNYGRVGNADHHAMVAMIGAWLLLACARLACPDLTRRELARWVAALAVARAALVLTWHGSLLYVGLADGALFLAAALTGRGRLLRAELVSALGSLAIVAPVVWISPPPLGGDYSSIALSRLHVLVIGAVAALAAVLRGLARVRPPASWGERVARTAVVAVVLLGGALLLPGPREGVLPALQFLTLRDSAGELTGEQFPLFHLFGRAPRRHAIHSWGFYAYLLPAAPVGLWWTLRRQPERVAAAGVVAGWSLVLAILTLLQRRYGNDLAVGAAVCLATVLAALGRGAAARAGWRPVAGGVLAVVLGVLLLSPPLVTQHLQRARALFVQWRAGEPPVDRARLVPAGALYRFAQAVRRVTPETAGFLDTNQQPEYGLIAHANLGHALQYVARRPTPTDPFWAYIGQRNWDHNFAFLAARSEAEALPLARALRARYVVTMPGAGQAELVGRLHAHDGTRGRPVEHFRLIVEGPVDGRPLSDIFGEPARGRVPYKLFEIVAGAVLEVRGAPGSEVQSTVALRSPVGRRFTHRARTRVSEEGVAHLRVPYATEPTTPVRAEGPYRVRVGERELDVPVREADVLEGATIPVR